MGGYIPAAFKARQNQNVPGTSRLFSPPGWKSNHPMKQEPERLPQRPHVAPSFLVQVSISQGNLLHPTRLGALCSPSPCNPPPSLPPQELPHPFARSHTCTTPLHLLQQTQRIQNIYLPNASQNNRHETGTFQCQQALKMLKNGCLSNCKSLKPVAVLAETQHFPNSPFNFLISPEINLL